MEDYISREELRKQFNNVTLPKECIKMYLYPRDVVARILYDCPSADVRENIHGEWETRYEIIRHPWGEEHNPQTKCSNCNFRVDTHSSGFMNFCPNCGADMRGKAE